MTVLNENCGEGDCNAQLLRVEYKEGKSKLAGDATQAEGCIFCDSALSSLVEKQHAVFMRRRNQGQTGGGGSAAAGGRGRGRGRGRRGRGGGGAKAPKDKMSQLAAYFV